MSSDLLKAMDHLKTAAEPLCKAGAGEGSRGGKVIGHTSGGKPIEQSTPRSADTDKSMDPEDKPADKDLEKKCGMKKSMVMIGGVPHIVGDESLAKSIEDGMVGLDVPPMNDRLQKGTIIEADLGPSNPRGETDPILRQQVIDETIEIDPAGNGGAGGLAQWFAMVQPMGGVEDVTDPYLAIESRKLDRIG